MASASANCIEPLCINSHSLLFTWDQRPERQRHTPLSRLSQLNLVSFLCWWKVGVRGGGGVKKCPPSAISHLSVGGNVIDWNWMEWIGNEVFIDGLGGIITCHNPVTFHRELLGCVGYYSPLTNTSIVLTTSGLLLHLSDNFNIDVRDSNDVWLVHGRIESMLILKIQSCFDGVYCGGIKHKSFFESNWNIFSEFLFGHEINDQSQPCLFYHRHTTFIGT